MNGPEPRWKVCHSANSNEWRTPQEVINHFGPFDIDVCATPGMEVCANFISPEMDGLKQPWGDPGDKAWCNPPYSAIYPWVAKAIGESGRGITTTMLVPSRTCQSWWHVLLGKVALRAADLYLCRGRLRFGNAKASAPFPSAVFVIHGMVLEPTDVEYFYNKKER